MTPRLVRLLVVPQMGGWVAHGIEYNIVAQGPTPELAFRAFVRTFRAQVHLDRLHGRAPLSSTGEAPDSIRELFLHIQARGTEPLTALPVRTPEDDIPEAYVIRAISPEPLGTALH